MGLKNILLNLPEIAAPTEKRLPFKQKLKWTVIILFLFYFLGLIPLFGLGKNALEQFEFLSIILGAEFGSLISLGIGPIVTASILLQLMNGSGILKFDLTTPDGKRLFQGIQKALALAFVVFEAFIYVFTGGFAPAAGYSPLLIVFQLILGGIMILLMDEVVSKWGFGQGISLFIVAGVSKGLIISLLSPFSGPGVLGFVNDQPPAGALLSIFYSINTGAFNEVAISLAAILATVFVFVIAVYAQAMKVEVPLSMGRIRGHGIRWPLAFIYTSVIPVILTAALLANVQLGAALLDSKEIELLGKPYRPFNPETGDPGQEATGIVAWLSAPPNILEGLITGATRPIHFARAATYALFLICGAVLFSLFWVKTAGMDARSQAKRMMDYGLQIPGFRKDERVLESLLNRYIPALTVLGGITVGFLAALADLSGALTQGTGLLLAVMIIYKLYEEIAQQHAVDMNPMLRKFMEK